MSNFVYVTFSVWNGVKGTHWVLISLMACDVLVVPPTYRKFMALTTAFVLSYVFKPNL